MNLRFQYNRLIDYYRKNGLLKTTRKFFLKVKEKIFNKNKKIEIEENENYRIWIKENEPNEYELEEQRKYKFEYEPKISVIVPMYNTKEKYLKELIESLIEQTYTNWELCLADGSNEKREYVDKLVNQDKRIKYNFLGENKGIAGNSNSALELATGDYVALLDHDDILPKFSFFEIVKTINENKDAEFIYTDEDKLLEDKDKRMGPHFKPDYAPDTLMSYNYICHFSIFKKEFMDKLGGFRTEFDGSQDYDLIFRATEQANKIIHIPKILYHWRMNIDSVALSSEAKPYAYKAAKKAILAHLERIGEKGKVEDSSILGIYNVIYEVKDNPKVSIIIPNKDHKKDLERCINSILTKTTYNNYEIIVVENNSETKEISEYYNKIKNNQNIKIVRYNEKIFNYSKINNFGVKNATGEYIVLLNNDTKIITENWLEIMLGNCQRKDVGIVGAKLLYENQTVQHVGVVLGLTGIAGHINSGLEENEPGYMARNIIIQNYSAVTGAMLMISKKDYEDVNGLDENFPVAYNDIDLCLKIREKNKVIVINPNVKAYHYESKTRGYENSKEKIERLENDTRRLKRKWKDVFEKEDPYFNPNFRKDVGIMRVKIKRQDREKVEDKKSSIKTIFFVLIIMLITMMFFSYQTVITWDSSHYLKLASLFSKDADFTQWDVVRGPTFPLYIKISNILFGQSSVGVLVGMFAFYVAMIIGCYYIYKDSISNEKCLSEKIKVLLITLWFFLVAINPMIFGFYHTLLTEFIAMTVAVLSCYFAWKWINIDFKTSKIKYIIYTLTFSIATVIMWFLKQPYVTTVIFPVIIAAIISFVTNKNLKNFIQRSITIIICIIALAIGIKTWNFILKITNVPINQDRTSSGTFSAQLINGETKYGVLNNTLFDTVEEIENCEKINAEDKNKMINVLNEDSEYKSYLVIDLEDEEYKIIYAKRENLSMIEAIKVWFEVFCYNPLKIINNYLLNYLGTISIYQFDFNTQEKIVINKQIDLTTTTEIATIGYRIYNYGTDTVFYLSEEYEPYATPYRNINRPIVATNWIMIKLQKPVTIALKISYILLPILTITAIVMVFKSKKRYNKKYNDIINLITILFTYSLLHIMVHAVLGATIDRYTMPVLITTFLGILLTIYVIIYRKKYKI